MLENDADQETRLNKGLLGVVAIAVLGGAGGTLVYTAFGGSGLSASSDRAPDNTIDVADTTSGVDVAPAIKPDVTVDGPARLPAEAGTIVVDPPAPKIEQSQQKPFDMNSPPPPPNTLKRAAFVVKFNRGDKIDECLALYRKDKDASRKAFLEWASHHPELAGMRLEKVSYSGEAVLAYDGAKDPDPVSNAKQIAARLNGSDAVKYADPDYTAFPGKGD